MSCAKTRRLLKQQRQQLPSVKRRRFELKQERASTQGANEALEGISYQSGVGHLADVDVEKLPDAIPKGNFHPVKLECSPTVVTFDLETTDLIRGGEMPDITQIAALNTVSGQSFSTYVKPETLISAEAQRITGISVDEDGNMFVQGKSVSCVSAKQGLQMFCGWLSQFQGVILVAHNGRRFDFPVLVSACDNINCLQLLLECTAGFVDSLPVFKKLYPNQSHKQEDLAKNILGMSYNAHDACSDVAALAKLLSACDKLDIMAYSYPPTAVYHALMFNSEKNKNIRSLDVMVSRGIFKRPTAENIAGSGLSLKHLQAIYIRSGEDGLRDTFTAKNSEGMPRVTSAKKDS